MGNEMICPATKALVIGLSLWLVGCTSTRHAPVIDLESPVPQVVAAESQGTIAPSQSSDIEVQAVPDDTTQAIVLPAVQSSVDQEPANPAVVALLNAATSHSIAGQHDAAAVSLERALQIEPDNAWVWHRLARTRLAQGELEEAANLAIRSNTFAVDDRVLLADNWRLIATTREYSGDASGARAANLRADQFSGSLN